MKIKVNYQPKNKIMKANKWIKVTDRLPKVCSEVIVCITKCESRNIPNSYPWIMTGWYSELCKTGWCYTVIDENVDIEVSHWMPMPEPPNQ